MPARAVRAARRSGGVPGRPQASEATARAFIEPEGGRFCRSGDLGRVDEEGDSFMADCLKRMIELSGFKVWPAEVQALMFRYPAFGGACVIGTRDA